MLPIKNGPQIINGRVLHVKEEFKEQLKALGISAESDWLNHEPGELFNFSLYTKVYKNKLSSGQVIFCKIYSLKKEPMRYFMRTSKCTSEVRSYQILSKLNIPTVTPIAVGEERLYGALKSCCIVTIESKNIANLYDFALNTWRLMEPSEKQKAFKQIHNSLVKYVRKMHSAKFFHYDLKWRNILIDKQDGKYTLSFIDAPRGKIMKVRHERGKIVDLSCLSRDALSYLRRSQRFKFLKDYLGKDNGSHEVKKLWKKIEQHLSRRPPNIIEFPED